VQILEKLEYDLRMCKSETATTTATTTGPDLGRPDPSPSSPTLSHLWRPDRCPLTLPLSLMSGGATYDVLWRGGVRCGGDGWRSGGGSGVGGVVVVAVAAAVVWWC
jgi:hypothetical protein